MNKPMVAFVCVHSSCRSQIAEALGRHLAADVFESYSAGTELKERLREAQALTLAGRILPDGLLLVRVKPSSIMARQA